MADPLRWWAQACVRPIIKNRDNYTDEKLEELLIQTLLGGYDAGKQVGIELERGRMIKLLESINSEN